MTQWNSARRKSGGRIAGMYRVTEGMLSALEEYRGLKSWFFFASMMSQSTWVRWAFPDAMLIRETASELSEQCI